MAANKKNSGQFQKGNPGKPKGAKNRTTEQIKECIRLVLSDNLDILQTDLDNMSPYNRWTILEKLSKYAIPALTKADVEAAVKGDMKITVLFSDKTMQGLNPPQDSIDSQAISEP